MPYARARQALTSFACKQAPLAALNWVKEKGGVIVGNLGGRDGTLEGPRNRGDKALKGEKARPTRPKCAEGRDIQKDSPQPPSFSTRAAGSRGCRNTPWPGVQGGGAPPARGSGVSPERGRNVSGFLSSREGKKIPGYMCMPLFNPSAFFTFWTACSMKVASREPLNQVNMPPEVEGFRDTLASSV